LLSAVDPTSGLLAGLVWQFVVGMVRRVRDKATDQAAERLWDLLKDRLSPEDVAQAESGSRQDAWVVSLRERIERVLADDPQLMETARRMLLGTGGHDEALWQLPADNPEFANRLSELDKICRALRPGSGVSLLTRAARRAFGRGGATTGAIVEISGPALIGKTELAIHAAHELADEYPDGCFVVDLGGPLGWSGAVTDGLVDLLRAQGTPLREIPETRELALRRYRSWFHQKRALVVIENASDAEQVRTFLPPDRRCGAIVTSSYRMLNLGYERLCSLDAFTHKASLAMLRDLDASADRWSSSMPVTAEHSARRIVEWCGRHPAIIASVAAWMSQPRLVDRSLSDVAAQLWSAGSGETAQVLGASRLSTGLRLLYEQAAASSPDAARLYRLLGLLSVPYVDSALASALAGTSRTDTDRALGELVNGGMLRLDGEHYRMAGYQQRFAEAMARSLDSAATREAALARAFRHLLRREEPWATDQAATTLQQMEQVSRQRVNWISAIICALTEGLYEMAWRLALRCAEFFQDHGYVHAWATTARLGVAAADALHSEQIRLEALASGNLNLAAALAAQHAHDDGTLVYITGVQHARDLTRLGMVHLERAEPAAAQRCLAASKHLADRAHDQKHLHEETEKARTLLGELDTNIEVLSKMVDPKA
jgi:hypothetical protein